MIIVVLGERSYIQEGEVGYFSNPLRNSIFSGEKILVNKKKQDNKNFIKSNVPLSPIKMQFDWEKLFCDRGNIQIFNWIALGKLLFLTKLYKKGYVKLSNHFYKPSGFLKKYSVHYRNFSLVVIRYINVEGLKI